MKEHRTMALAVFIALLEEHVNWAAVFAVVLGALIGLMIAVQIR